MSIPSFHNVASIAITSSASLLGDTGVIDDEIASKVTAYNDEIRANLWSFKASFTIVDQLEAALQWMEKGLGSDISTYSHALDRIFRGFVNKVSVSYGSLQVETETLLDTINQLTVTYQTMSYNTNPPVGGTQAITDVATEDLSQETFGIFVGSVSASEGTAEQIEAFRDFYVQELAWPQPNSTISFSGGGELSVKIEVVGYARLLEKFFVTDNTVGEGNASTKINTAVSADPNSLFTLTAGISENTLQVGLAEDGNRSGMAVIKDVVARGDSSNNRWLFYIDVNNVPVYRAAPTATKYYHSVGESRRSIVDVMINEVFPWSVPAGEWIEITDFPFNPTQANSRQQADKQFVEIRTYTAPYDFQAKGARNTQLDQRMAQLGIGGTF